MTATLDPVDTHAQAQTVAFHNGVMGDRLDMDITDHLFWCRDVRELSPNTIRIRRGVLNRLSDTIGIPLRDAQVGHLQRWQSQILTGRAAETKKVYISQVSAFYVWALRRGLVADNPAVLLDRPKVPKGLPHPISEEDLAAAILAARPKLAAMIILTAYAGLRAMEVAGLQWNDIRSTPHGWVLYIRGKGRRERLVPVGSTVIAALRAHGWNRRGPVFLGRDGRAISPNAVSQTINEHYARLDISATSHYGRHRYVSAGVEDVGDVSAMQHLAGHESLSTTQIYAAFSPAKAAQVVAALEKRAKRSGITRRYRPTDLPKEEP